MKKIEQRIKSIREKLVREKDVSFEDSLFIWKVLNLEKENKGEKQYAGIHKELLAWHETVLEFIKNGNKGIFIESLPVFPHTGLAADLRRAISQSLDYLDEEEKKRELTINAPAYSYILKNLSPLSFFDIITCRPSIGSPNFSNMMNLEFLRCGVYKRMFDERELYVKPNDDHHCNSTIGTIREKLLKCATFPIIFKEGCVATPKEYEERLNDVLSTTEEEVISAVPGTRMLFDEKWRSENILKYFNSLNNAVLHMAGNFETDFNFDGLDDLMEAQRIKRAMQKEDVSKEESDEIFLDIFVADVFDNTIGSCLPCSLRIFEDWIKFVYKKARKAEKGNFLASVPVITKRHFKEITTKIRDRLPGEYTAGKAYLFNIDVEFDPEIGVIVDRNKKGRIEISSLRLGKINEILEAVKIKPINFSNKDIENISDLIFDIDAENFRFMDYFFEPKEKALMMAKLEILITNGFPVIALKSPRGDAWWSSNFQIWTERSKDTEELLCMSMEEAFKGLNGERFLFKDIVKAVERNYKIKKDKRILSMEDDWVAMDR